MYVLSGYESFVSGMKQHEGFPDALTNKESYGVALGGYCIYNGKTDCMRDFVSSILIFLQKKQIHAAQRLLGSPKTVFLASDTVRFTPCPKSARASL